MSTEHSTTAATYARDVACELERLFRGNPSFVPVHREGERGQRYEPLRHACAMCDDGAVGLCAEEQAREAADLAPEGERVRVAQLVRRQVLAQHAAPSTLDDWIAHVEGVHFRGSYTVSPDGTTDQIAADLDAHGDPDHLRLKPHARLLALVASARALGVLHAFVGSTSRGGAGRHARLCVDRATPAWLAAAIGSAWVRHAGIDPEPDPGTAEHDEWLARFGENPDGGVEIYPKQIKVNRERPYGNLLATPCSRPLYEHGRTVLLSAEGLPVGWEGVLNSLRSVRPLALDELQELARKLGIDPDGPDDRQPPAVPPGQPSLGRSSSSASHYTTLVLDAVSIERAFELLGLPHPGIDGRVDCPLHTGSQHPRTMSVGDGLFRCFSSRCNRAGNAIHLAGYYRGITYVEARDWLAEKSGVKPREYFDSATTATAAAAPSPADRVRAALLTPGAVLLDRRGPGCGKSWTAADVLTSTTFEGQTLVFGPNHLHHDRELFPMIEAAAKRHRREHLVAKWPKPVCPIGRTAEIEDVSRRGFNYARLVCAGCPHSTERLAALHRVSFCKLRKAQKEAREAPILLVQHASLGHGESFWRGGLGEGIGRIVIDENAVERLGREVLASTRSLGAYEKTLARARQLALDALEGQFLDIDTGDIGPLPYDEKDISEVLDRVLEGFRSFRVVVETALKAEGHVLTVPPPSSGDWRRLLATDDVGQASDQIDRVVAVSRAPLMNVLPLAVHAAQTWASEQPLVLLRTKSEPGCPGRGFVRSPIPARVSVVVLDATGEPRVLERILGRSVGVLDGGTAPKVDVMQVTTGGLRSKRQLRVMTSAVDRDAQMIARRIVQAHLGRNDVVGVVSYKSVVANLVDRVRDRLRRWRNRVRMPSFKTLHWFAARGSNDLKGAALVVIHGCPNPNPYAVRRLAHLLGASPSELSEEAQLEVVDVSGVKIHVRTYRTPLMEQARRALVDAELVQGLGRSTRGSAVPRAGVLALTNYPLNYGVVKRCSAAEAGLDRDFAVAPRLDDNDGRDSGAEACAEQQSASDTSVVTSELSRTKRQSLEDQGDAAGPSYCTSIEEALVSDLQSVTPAEAMSAGAAPAPPNVAKLVARFGRDHVATAAGVTTRTVRRWVAGEALPRGRAAAALHALQAGVTTAQHTDGTALEASDHSPEHTDQPKPASLPSAVDAWRLDRETLRRVAPGEAGRIFG